MPAADLEYDVVGLERREPVDHVEDVAVDQEVLTEAGHHPNTSAAARLDRRPKLLVRNPTLDRQRPSRVHHVGRLVGLAAHGLRREIRRVGLDQQPLRGHPKRRHPQGLRLRIGDVARERDPPVRMREALLDPVGHREAVQDHAQAAGVGLEQSQRVVLGRSGVDHQRLADRARQRDLGPEGALLVVARRVVAVVVQAGLADRHALGMGGQRFQLGQVGVVEPGGRVRVAPDRGVDLRKVLGRRQRGPAGRAVRAHRDDPAHPGRQRRGHQLRVRGLAQLQVRVAVDHSALGEQRLDRLDRQPAAALGEHGAVVRHLGSTERQQQLLDRRPACTGEAGR